MHYTHVESFHLAPLHPNWRFPVVDYSKYIHDEGLVKFTNSAARYVPDIPGIYHILVVPYSQSAPCVAEPTETYLNAIKHPKLDVRDSPNPRFLPPSNHGEISINIRPRLPHRIVDGSRKPASLFRLAAMFPPVYVGQAIDLRRRFVEHDRGINSDLRIQLTRHGLANLMSFFKWHRCDPLDLDHIESVLIQAYLPIFNKRMR